MYVQNVCYNIKYIIFNIMIIFYLNPICARHIFCNLKCAHGTKRLGTPGEESIDLNKMGSILNKDILN